MTVIIQTNTVFERSGPGRLGAKLDFPANHKAILAIPSLKAWFNATTGFGPQKGVQTWMDRRFNNKLTPDGSNFPSLVPNAIGTKSALQFGHQARRLIDLGNAGLIPLTGNYTIAGVARAGANMTGNWAIFGNAGATGAYDALLRRTDGKFQIYRNGSNVGITTAVYTSQAPFFFVLSWDRANSRLILRVNGAQALSISTSLDPSNTQLIVGATQALPGTAAGGASLTTLAEAFVGDLLVFNGPLAAAGNEGDLATVEASFLTDYGAIFS